MPTSPSAPVDTCVYLDNAATSFPKPESVYQALDRFARQSLANPGRAGHKMALAAERALDDGRHLLNQFFHGKEPERFVFTLNCTDALNMAFKGVLADGDHVITTNLEHNSVSRPLRAPGAGRPHHARRACRPTAAGPSIPTTCGRPSRRETRLIALTHASNVLGTVQPIAEIGRIAREHDLLVPGGCGPDGRRRSHRRAGHEHRPARLPGPQVAAGADRHRGALRRPARPACRPGARAAPAATPPARRSRASCPTSSKAARPTSSASPACAPAFATCRKRGSSAIHAARSRADRAAVAAAGRDGRLRGVRPSRPCPPRAARSASAASTLPAAELGGILDQAFDIAIRPGLHCAPYIHRALGTFPDGAVRVSPGPFNTADDIDHLADALAEISL